MDKYEQKKLIEIVLYILNKTGGIDLYHLFKIMYFAERSHLAKWGRRITADDFCAIDFGPIPSKLYDAIKGNTSISADLLKLVSDNIYKAGEDAPNVLMTNSTCDMNYLSMSEIKELDQSISENQYLSFEALKDKSHDLAWKNAFSKKRGHIILSSIDMAKAIHADKQTLEYIEEQINIDLALA